MTRAAQDAPSCTWVDDCGDWIPDCDKGGFQFNHGGPVENGFKFCPYCGKPLVEDPYSEEPSDAK